MEKKSIFDLRLMEAVYENNIGIMCNALHEKLVETMKKDPLYRKHGYTVLENDVIRLIELTKEYDRDEELFDEAILSFVSDDTIIDRIKDEIGGLEVFEPESGSKALVSVSRGTDRILDDMGRLVTDGLRITLTEKEE